MLDELGIVHMNGRLYDPEIARVLSGDPAIQEPDNSQNYNRYSYVANNPLSFTDPSGYFFKKLFNSAKKLVKKAANAVKSAFKKVTKWVKENWQTIVVIAVVAIVSWGVGTALTASGSAAFTSTTAGVTSLNATGMAVTGGAAGAVGGGLSAGLSGGDLGDVLKGALVGGIQGAIAGGVLHGWSPDVAGFNFETARHVAGHGVLGGSANYAMGGKFQDGFFSAAAGVIGSYSSFANGGIVSRTVKAGVIGGTVAEIGGGKFANGAYTAAFQHLLNYEASRYLRNVSGQKELDKATKAIEPLRNQMQRDMAAGLATELTAERFNLLLAYSKAQIIVAGHHRLNSYDLHINELGHADNEVLFGNFTNHRFKSTDSGIIYSGSDVNYIHVGMMMRANGFNYHRIVGYTTAWNAWEGVTGDDNGSPRSWQNFRNQTEQMGPAAAFAIRGAIHWDLGD
jgi:RHS repeat-associated protein